MGRYVMHSLNAPAAVVTHTPAPVGSFVAPLCGFIKRSETVTAEPYYVTCLDCLAADGRYTGRGLSRT